MGIKKAMWKKIYAANPFSSNKGSIELSLIMNYGGINKLFTGAFATCPKIYGPLVDT